MERIPRHIKDALIHAAAVSLFSVGEDPIPDPELSNEPKKRSKAERKRNKRNRWK